MRIALILLAACTASTAPQGVVYDSYVSIKWHYRYTYQTYSEGLDSVSGQLRINLGRASDSLTASGDVTGYFWAKGVQGDTARGAGVVWPASLVLRGLYTESNGRIRIVASSPSDTWLTRIPSEIQRQGPDTLVYVFGIVTADSQSVSLIVTFVK